ncbi:MAG TPA: glycoside hydrolase family 5 protein [Actinopolymorphaceae bacterium]
MFSWLSTRYRNTTMTTRLAAVAVPVVLAVVAAVLAGSFTSSSDNQMAAQLPDSATQPEFPLHADGGKIVDSAGQTVTLTGVNWFGFETETFAPHGLWARNWKSMLDQMQQAGFNTLRLPYTNQLFDPQSKPTGINYHKNPDLKGLRGLALLDRIVTGATDRGIMVVLDRHRPTAAGQSDLWYTDEVSEQRWIEDWTMLARHYKDNPLVIGADLHNEPKGSATWGSGDRTTDWKLAAERAGNEILKVNPNWLIIVQGIEQYNKDYYWWGGNLQGVAKHPVKLADQSKLVYSAHDYGPGVWRQKWFDAADFPNNLPKIWKKQWAYIPLEGRAPLLLGEFGGRSVSPNTKEGIWQRSLVQFLKEHGISYTYWSWNPNSGDTGGVLRDNWRTVNQEKLDLLKTYLAPQLPTKEELAQAS